MFAIGDVVVCVDAKPKANGTGQAARHLREGRAYRVVGTSLSYRGALRLHPGGVISSLTGEQGKFFADRFRKIQKADDQFIERVKACRPRHRERIEAFGRDRNGLDAKHESCAEGLAQ